MGIYSLARSAYWSIRHYPANCYRLLLAESEHWSSLQMEDFRNKKLATLIAHCYDNVPYYRRVMDFHGLQPQDIQRAEDLSKLPILTKNILRTSSRELLAHNVSRDGHHLVENRRYDRRAYSGL